MLGLSTRPTAFLEFVKLVYFVYIAGNISIEMENLLRLTGQPKIISYDASATETILPYPTYDDFLDGGEEDESVWVEMDDGSEILARGPRNRTNFAFGYDWMSLQNAEALIQALRPRILYFVPRTFLVGDDPSAVEEMYLCRYIGRLPKTQHLTREYRITDIELRVIEALD